MTSPIISPFYGFDFHKYLGVNLSITTPIYTWMNILNECASMSSIERYHIYRELLERLRTLPEEVKHGLRATEYVYLCLYMTAFMFLTNCEYRGFELVSTEEQYNEWIKNHQ